MTGLSMPRVLIRSWMDGLAADACIDQQVHDLNVIETGLARRCLRYHGCSPSPYPRSELPEPTYKLIATSQLNATPGLG